MCIDFHLHYVPGTPGICLLTIRSPSATYIGFYLSKGWISPLFLEGRVVWRSNSKVPILRNFLYNSDKEALVLDYLESSHSYVRWNPSFVREVED
jgi:hypothetical protein